MVRIAVILVEVELFLADLVSTMDERSSRLNITCTISEHEGHFAYFPPFSRSSCIEMEDIGSVGCLAVNQNRFDEFLLNLLWTQ